VQEHEFAAVMAALGRFFCDADGRPAKLAWEVPGPGLTVTDRLIQMGYGNVWCRPRDPLDKFNKGWSSKPGWSSNPRTKLMLLEDYRQGVQSGRCKVYSADSLDETLAFAHTPQGVEHGNVDMKGDPSGARVNHSDLAMSAALMWLVIKEFARAPAERPVESGPPFNSVLWRQRQRQRRRAEEEVAYE
jgi:hypothetical protein